MTSAENMTFEQGDFVRTLRPAVLPEQCRIVAELDALKRLQTETATELDALPPSPRLRRTGLSAILPSSGGFVATGDRSWTPSFPIQSGCALSLRESRLARSQRAQLKGEL